MRAIGGCTVVVLCAFAVGCAGSQRTYTQPAYEETTYEEPAPAAEPVAAEPAPLAGNYVEGLGNPYIEIYNYLSVDVSIYVTDASGEAHEAFVAAGGTGSLLISPGTFSYSAYLSDGDSTSGAYVVEYDNMYTWLWQTEYVDEYGNVIDDPYGGEQPYTPSTNPPGFQLITVGTDAELVGSAYVSVINSTGQGITISLTNDSGNIESAYIAASQSSDYVMSPGTFTFIATTDDGHTVYGEYWVDEYVGYALELYPQ